jgi:exodeoxyribonuclease VII small subunit
MPAKHKQIKLAQLESTLEELEQLVVQLESGDLPLEQALKQFEHGIKLTRLCQSALQDAEQKVEILLKQSVDGKTTDFEPDD